MYLLCRSSSGGSSSTTSGGSSSSSSSGSPSSGSSSSGGSSPSIPSFDPNKVNNIQASFLDPSKLQLGQSGGGGGGFDPDQINSMSFSFFNPNALLNNGGNSGPTGKRMYIFYIYIDFLLRKFLQRLH